jgi:HSP20 family protein
MAQSRWEATQELLRLQERVNRLFGRGVLEHDDDDLMGGSWTPPCDILESKDAVILRAEMAGVRQDQIEIHVAGNILTLRGERVFEKQDGEIEYHRIERSYGAFGRSFTLPTNVAADQISAEYRDGVLEIRMPKRQEALPRQIKVNIG